MKKPVLFLLSILLCGAVNSQTAKQEHSISVIGTAEMEIVPDEMYMSIILKEYTKDKKKYSIEELEKNLVNYIEKVAMTDKKDIRMDNMSAYILSLKRKNKDEIVSKSYDVKFKSAHQVYLVYSAMDSLGISSAYVSKYSHSNMDEYKKQIKINAIKAARDKAGYLLEAIGQKAGKAISVRENSGVVTVNDGRHRNSLDNSYSQSNTRYSGGDDDYSGGADSNVIGNKTIKLHYSIDAEFEIQ